MSLNRDLEKIFTSYSEQIKKSVKKKVLEERKKHGNSYISHESYEPSTDANIFNLTGDDAKIRDDLFKKCVRDVIDDSDGSFQKHLLYLGKSSIK